MKKTKQCDFFHLFGKEAVGYIESTQVVTRRYFVCEKHKDRILEDSEDDSFRNTMSPKVEFISFDESK